MITLVIDNYDSFTFNLVQLIGHFETGIIVKRNDEITTKEISDLSPNRILISPGPGKPEDSKISLDVIERFADSIPILGVCLGHQAIAISFGGKVIQAPELVHGKSSMILHNNKGIFNGIPQRFDAGRYHSLIVEKSSLPDTLDITALTEDGLVMGLRHKEYPMEGVQFHPESILSEHGLTLMKNWLLQK